MFSLKLEGRMPEETNDLPERLLTELDVAGLLNVSVRTLQGWRLRGGGPRFIKLSPGMVRYRRCDLNEFLERRRCASTTEAGNIG